MCGGFFSKMNRCRNVVLSCEGLTQIPEALKIFFYYCKVSQMTNKVDA